MSSSMTTVSRASTPTVSVSETAAASDPYTRLADELVELAEAVAALAGRGLPAPDYAGFGMQVAYGETDEVITATVDTIGETIGGKPGRSQTMLDKTTIHHSAYGRLGSITTNVYQKLARTAGGEA
jgi:hypothetical protein